MNSKRFIQLYKYQKINLNSIKLLSEECLWVANYASLNDPFEYINRPNWHLSKDSKELILGANEKVKIKREVEAEIKELGVTSYCTNDDSKVIPLMWSHYADGHKGMCLIFEVPRVLIGNEIRKVEYHEYLPLIDFNQSNDKVAEAAFDIITTKSSAWEYEKEVRSIHRFSNKSYPYIGQLVEIQFGCKCNLDDALLVKRTVERVNPDCKFSKLKIQEGAFFLSRHYSSNSEVFELLFNT